MSNDPRLEAKIAAWKHDLSHRLRDREAVDELESHLRDLLAEAVTAGSNADDAWRTALRRLGDAPALQREFAKLSGTAWLDASAILVVGMIVLGLIMPLVQLIFHGSPAMQADRLLGTHVLTISLGYISAVGCGLLGTYAVLRTLVGGATNRVLDRWIPLGVVVLSGLESALMLAGIVLGAVWAGGHLGRVWGWDVKEIGAAVTALFHLTIFTLALKRCLSNEMLLALASVGATLSLFAWFGPFAFGVGLRTYGFPGFTLIPLITAALISAGIMLLAVRRRRAIAD